MPVGLRMARLLRRMAGDRRMDAVEAGIPPSATADPCQVTGRPEPRSAGSRTTRRIPLDWLRIGTFASLPLMVAASEGSFRPLSWRDWRNDTSVADQSRILRPHRRHLHRRHHCPRTGRRTYCRRSPPALHRARQRDFPATRPGNRRADRPKAECVAAVTPLQLRSGGTCASTDQESLGD